MSRIRLISLVDVQHVQVEKYRDKAGVNVNAFRVILGDGGAFGDSNRTWARMRLVRKQQPVKTQPIGWRVSDYA
jgi:hypothetical protein